MRIICETCSKSVELETNYVETESDVLKLKEEVKSIGWLLIEKEDGDYAYCKDCKSSSYK